MIPSLISVLNLLKTAQYYAASVLVPVIHLVFAAAVWVDARRSEACGVKPVLVSGWVWALATLVMGPLIAALYWAMHHSALARDRQLAPSRVS